MATKKRLRCNIQVGVYAHIPEAFHHYIKTRKLLGANKFTLNLPTFWNTDKKGQSFMNVRGLYVEGKCLTDTNKVMHRQGAVQQWELYIRGVNFDYKG